MNTKAIRQSLNLSQSEFSKKFDIPLGTVKNWDARDCMPDYIGNLFMKIEQGEVYKRMYLNYMERQNKR